MLRDHEEIERLRKRAMLIEMIWIAVGFAVLIAVLAMLPNCSRAWAEPVDVVRAQQLAAKMLAWQPTRQRDADEIRTVAGLLVRACKRMRSPMPDADGCPELLAGITFRESSWRPEAIGSRGEVGLFQLHGRALAGVPPLMAMEPETNVRLGRQWLDYAARVCARWKDDDTHTERALSAYAGLGCVTSQNARLALRYADEIGERNGQ